MNQEIYKKAEWLKIINRTMKLKSCRFICILYTNPGALCITEQNQNCLLRK